MESEHYEIHPKVAEIAQILGVEIQQATRLSGRTGRPSCVLPRKKKVLLDLRKARAREVEFQLHEVMHACLTPPRHALDNVYENFVLMQVERAYAKEFMTRSDFGRVVDWQLDTCVFGGPDMLNTWILESYVGWWKKRIWIDGIVNAQAIGMLDDQARPTLKPPVWPKFDLYKRWIKGADTW